MSIYYVIDILTFLSLSLSLFLNGEKHFKKTYQMYAIVSFHEHLIMFKSENWSQDF